MSVQRLRRNVLPSDCHLLATFVGRTPNQVVYDDLADARIGSQSVHFLVDPQQRLTIDQLVRLRFDEQKMQFFDPQTGQSLLW